MSSLLERAILVFFFYITFFYVFAYRLLWMLLCLRDKDTCSFTFLIFHTQHSRICSLHFSSIVSRVEILTSLLLLRSVKIFLQICRKCSQTMLVLCSEILTNLHEYRNNNGKNGPTSNNQYNPSM